MVKNSHANAGASEDTGSIPGSGKSPGGGNGNPPQYSCLENLKVRRACWATVYRVVKELHMTEETKQQQQVRVLSNGA